LFFLAQIGYPYQLTLASPGNPIDSVTGTSGSGVPATALTTVSNTPATASGTYSTLTVQLTITPTSQMCTLNGVYATSNTRFQITCVPAAANNCPSLLPSNTGVGITLTVSSSSFCGQVVENVGVTLEMNSYSDPNFSQENSAFAIQPNGYMYLEVTVASSPQVSVVSLYVDRVTINSASLPNGQLVLFDSINSNPPVTSAGTTFQYDGSSFNLPSGVNAGFSIGVDSSWNVAQDNQSPATVSAQVTVSYQGGAKKRSLMNIQTSTSGSTQTNSETAITLNSSPSSDKSQSSVVYSSCALVVLFLLLLQLL